MKKNLLMAVLAGSVMFLSCENDDDATFMTNEVTQKGGLIPLSNEYTEIGKETVFNDLNDKPQTKDVRVICTEINKVMGVGASFVSYGGMVMLITYRVMWVDNATGGGSWELFEVGAYAPPPLWDCNDLEIFFPR